MPVGMFAEAARCRFGILVTGAAFAIGSPLWFRIDPTTSGDEVVESINISRSLFGVVSVTEKQSRSPAGQSRSPGNVAIVVDPEIPMPDAIGASGSFGTFMHATASSGASAFDASATTLLLPPHAAAPIDTTNIRV
jgi:hypothetical protein